MATRLSCGHTDKHHPDGWICLVKSEHCDAEEGFARAFEAFAYCSDCMALALTEYPEELFTSISEAEEWVNDLL